MLLILNIRPYFSVFSVMNLSGFIRYLKAASAPKMGGVILPGTLGIKYAN
jgi:hypothetical protein